MPLRVTTIAVAWMACSLAAFGCGARSPAESPAAASASAEPSPEQWAALGMPSADAPWGPVDYERAALAIDHATAQDARRIPRARGPNAATFARMVDVANVDTIARGDKDASSLLGIVTAAMRIADAIRHAEELGGFDVEVQHSIGFSLHLLAVVWDVSDDVRSDESPQARAELAQTLTMLRGRTATHLASLADSLRRDVIHGPLDVLGAAVERDAGMLARRLDPETAEGLLSQFARVAASARSEPARIAREVSRAAELGPKADVVIAEREIRDGRGATLVPLPADRSHGVDAAYKRQGPNDLYVVPLVQPLQALATTRPPRMLVVDVAPSTPYRLLVEVLFTAGQSEWRGFDLRLAGRPLQHAVTHPPRTGVGLRSPLGLTVLVVDDGVSLKARGGNVAPGCADIGPGLAIPKRDGQHDDVALATCLAKLKSQFADETQVTIAANPSTPFDELLRLVAIARGRRLDLFPEVTWGLAR